MSEKLDKLRASLEKERERRIKINTRIESLERRIQEAEAAEAAPVCNFHPDPGCAVRSRCYVQQGGI